MTITERLAALLIERATKDPEWYKRNYEAAVARIKDYTSPETNPHAEQNPYWEGSFGTCALPDGPVMTEDGSTITAEDAEAEAWELLVLADLARMKA